MMLKSNWKGKKVAFIGDSITDAIHVGTEKNYWEFLREFLGIEDHIYGVNGMQWHGVRTLAEQIHKEMGDTVDAIFIFMGTNDYNSAVPLGHWWNIEYRNANVNGVTMPLAHRIPVLSMDTVCGRINTGMKYIRETFLRQQVVLMTPIHRSYATFGETNVQQDESFSNPLGLFVEQYIDLIRQAADIWSTPLIDLYRDSNLLPSIPAQSRFFHLADTDRLHPNADGHRRIALTMAYRMLALPPCL